MGRLIPGNRTPFRIGRIGRVFDMHNEVRTLTQCCNPAGRPAYGHVLRCENTAVWVTGDRACRPASSSNQTDVAK